MLPDCWARVPPTHARILRQGQGRNDRCRPTRFRWDSTRSVPLGFGPLGSAGIHRFRCFFVFVLVRLVARTRAALARDVMHLLETSSICGTTLHSKSRRKPRHTCSRMCALCIDLAFLPPAPTPDSTSPERGNSQPNTQYLPISSRRQRYNRFPL